MDAPGYLSSALSDLVKVQKVYIQNEKRGKSMLLPPTNISGLGNVGPEQMSFNAGRLEKSSHKDKKSHLQRTLRHQCEISGLKILR